MADPGTIGYRRVMRRLVCISVLPLVGCARIDTLFEVIDDLVSPTVAAGLYVGVDVPDGIDFGLDDDYAVAACELYLASIEDTTNLDEAPVDGAEAEFRSEQISPLLFAEQGDGKYRLTSLEGLRYVPGDQATVSFDEDFGAGTLGVEVPGAPSDPEIPSSVGALEDMQVSAGAEFDNVLVAVFDVESMAIVYSNLPDTFETIYEYTHPEARTSAVTIPGTAFPRSGLYAVGVAGMTLADPEDFEGVNISLSAFMAGRFAVGAVNVTPHE